MQKTLTRFIVAKIIKDKKTGFNYSFSRESEFILPIILIATFLVFWSSKNFGFVWDDNEYILSNPNLLSLSFASIKHIFSSFYAANYHPLTTVSWALEYSIWGANATGYHITNIVIHAINVCLVFVFVKLLVKDIWVTSISTTLFALHPMHVESIVWISERKDLLYTMFYVLSLVVYLKYIESKKHLYLLYCFVFFVLSCLSKSAAITLPVVLILIDYYKDSFSLKTVIQKSPFLAISFVFGIVAILSQKSVNAINVNILDFSLFHRFLLVCYSLYYYLFAFLLPVKQSALHFYPKDQSAFGIEYFIAPFVLLLLFLIVVFWKKHRKELFFGFGFYVITISLIVQFIPMGSAVVSERYSYVPYIGLAIMFMRILISELEQRKNALRNRKIAGFLLVFVLLLCAFQAKQRTMVWQNSETLFTDIVDKNPDAYYAYWFRSTARLNNNSFEDCISDCNMGLTLNSGYYQFYSVRGMAMLNLKRYKESDLDLTEYLKYKTDDGNIYFQRGKARREINNVKGTIEDYEKAIQLIPSLGTALVYVDLSNLKISVTDFNGSQKDLDKALQIEPNNTEALFNKGVNCFNAKLYKESIACFDRLIARNANDSEALYYRAIVKSTIGDKDAAFNDYKSAARLGNLDAQKQMEVLVK